MNQQRMMLKGQLADAEHKYRELELLAQASITAIMGYISITAGYEIADRQIREAAAQMKHLEEMHGKMKALKAQIAELKDALNG
jgi:cell division protein FtsB